MSFRALAFLAWCVVVWAAASYAAWHAWDPFADARHGSRGGGSSYFRGPTHK